MKDYVFEVEIVGADGELAEFELSESDIDFLVQVFMSAKESAQAS